MKKRLVLSFAAVLATLFVLAAYASAQIAVLAADPSKPVPYTIWLQFPANYIVPARSHPNDENVTVVSGDLFIGTGNKLDKKSATALGKGGYALMPANHNHFAFTRSEATILLYGVGPVDFTYVNPANDRARNNLIALR